jgi:undecaprenyl-diphosphatase
MAGSERMTSPAVRSFVWRFGQALATGWQWLLRKPRPMARPGLSPAEREQLIACALFAFGGTLFGAFFLDRAATHWNEAFPDWALAVIAHYTDLGRSAYMLWLLGLLLLACALIGGTALSAFQYRVLASIAVRIEFLFVAVAMPALFTSIVKRLVGRARPSTEAEPSVWLHAPGSFSDAFASMPSGHATAAFAALVAAGSLWPRAIPFLWVYAVAVAVSRLVLPEHFVSDVIVGAVIGSFGALLVRNAFAARGLVFLVRHGTIGPKPGPSLRRTKALLRAAAGR